MELSIAQACAGWHEVVPSVLQREITRTQSRWNAAKAAAWPRAMPEMLPAIGRAALRELCGRNNCGKCEGHRSLVVENLVRDCDECEGRGRVPLSDRARAELIGKPEATYRRSWRPCYEFALRAMRDAEQHAAEQLAAALGRGRAA